jgi:hypothetical protein
LPDISTKVIDLTCPSHGKFKNNPEIGKLEERRASRAKSIPESAPNGALHFLRPDIQGRVRR